MKAAAFEAEHWRRAWLISILDAAARAGLTPISQTVLHRAAFLSNALASVYGVEIENGLVTRWKRGPFYSELQWDLDRLATAGIARFERIRHLQDDDGFWFEIRYVPGDLMPAYLSAAKAVSSFAKVHRFHRELLAAMASIPAASQSDLALSDANYANTVDASIDEVETVIDFGQWEDRNFSARTAAAIDDQIAGLPSLDPRTRLHLYIRYLSSSASRERRGA